MINKQLMPLISSIIPWINRSMPRKTNKYHRIIKRSPKDTRTTKTYTSHRWGLITGLIHSFFTNEYTMEVEASRSFSARIFSMISNRRYGAGRSIEKCGKATFNLSWKDCIGNRLHFVFRICCICQISQPSMELSGACSTPGRPPEIILQCFGSSATNDNFKPISINSLWNRPNGSKPKFVLIWRLIGFDSSLIRVLRYLHYGGIAPRLITKSEIRAEHEQIMQHLS